MNVPPSRTTMIIRRALILILFFASVLVSVSAVAQVEPPLQTAPRAEKKQAGPRAVAVLEWTAKGPRLVPVTIKIDNQFYDASLYLAQPVPMALDSGVIYEVQSAGDPLGDFTLSEAEQTANGLWVGLGKFDSKADQEKRAEQAAKQKAAAEAAKKKEDSEDERPVLKRAAPKATETPAETAKTEKPAPTPTNSSPAPAATPAPVAPPQSTLSDADNNPDHPILRRGKPQQEQANALGNEKLPEKKPIPPPPGVTKFEVAVSDASPSQHHPYKWQWANPEEEQNMKSQVEKLAMATLSDYAKKVGGPTPGTLEDVNMQVYDLSFSNAPVVILSAKVLPAAPTPKRSRRGRTLPAPAAPAVTPGLEYYVTVVGQEDIYGKLQKEFTAATDNKHLDAFPRMQLVGIVDADGNGVGDLLFRSINDRSSAFVIYRNLGYSLQEVIRVPEPKV